MSLSRSDLLDIAAEYGLGDLREAAASAAYLRTVERPYGGRIESPAHYVGACLRLARRIGRESDTTTVYGRAYGDPDREVTRLIADDRAIDSRLIAVGFRHETPTAWIRDGRLYRFVDYYRRATVDGRAPGSPYNQTPERVYAAWRSGVPATAVRLQIWRGDGIRSLSTRERARLRRAVRAASRTSVARERSLGLPERITPAALSQLGRLSPEMQRALIEVSGGLPDTRVEGWRPLACRDLRWDLLAPIWRAVSADKTGRVRASMARGRRLLQLIEASCPEAATIARYGGSHSFALPSVRLVELLTGAGASPYGAEIAWMRAVAAWFAPSFPGVSVEQAQRLCRGESPVQISGGLLDKSEAHRWLLEAPELQPIEWLQRRLPSEVPPLRDIAVVRWLLAVQRRGSWDQLTRERRMHGPGGHEGTARYISRVDEVMSEDLARGEATRVEDAFRAAAERHGEAWLAKARQDHRVLAAAPAWRLFPRSMRYLRTAADLAREGDELHHCVGGYAPTVAEGRSIIVALRVGAERSTAELDARGRVLQHRGPGNGAPAPVLARLFERFLQRNGLGV